MARFAWLVLAATATLSLPTVASAQEGKRYAVLVGVNVYDDQRLSRLDYAVNDAVELGEVLEKAGYVVTVLSDKTGKGNPKLVPNKANIEATIKTVLTNAKKSDLVLLGFAGHGLQFTDDKDGYFCPSDARPVKNKADSLVSLKHVYGELDGSFAGMKVLLVDACRNDPFAGTRGVGADTAPVPPQGVAAIFSCKAGQFAHEVKTYKHGVFFYHVITGLQGEAADKKGRVCFASLAAHVGQSVPEDVTRLVGEGTVQTPNLKADYTNEPVLLTKSVPVKDRPVDEQLATDERAYIRAFGNGLNFDYLREATPRRLEAWQRAAEMGNPIAQVLLGQCLVWGIGVEKDLKEAVKWYTKAVESGYPLGMTSLGWLYEVGRGVEKDYKEAMRLYKKAADSGHPIGMMNTAWLYQFGRGVEQDNKEAANWFRKGAEAGYSMGMVNLGAMYANGSGVEQDDAQSFKWFKNAADIGNPFGMTYLGGMYEYGRGVEKDMKEALKLYRRAAELGNANAKKALERLGEK